MNQLRLEADEATGKVEELQAKVKTLEQENLSKEQEITSLSHKNNVLETEVEKLENLVKEHKTAADQGQQHGSENEALTRKLQLLEEEAEESDKHLREANERYVSPVFLFLFISVTSVVFGALANVFIFFFPPSLRQTDVKAGHLERKVQALESERDNWEKKYEDMALKYNTVQKELEEFQTSLSDI